MKNKTVYTVLQIMISIYTVTFGFMVWVLAIIGLIYDYSRYNSIPMLCNIAFIAYIIGFVVGIVYEIIQVVNMARQSNILSKHNFSKINLIIIISTLLIVMIADENTTFISIMVLVAYLIQYILYRYYTKEVKMIMMNNIIALQNKIIMGE